MKIKTYLFSSGMLAACVAGVLSVSTAHAQTEGPKSAALPAVAEAPEPYRSAFEGYQPYTEEKITNWKAANDTVDQIGGWREYAKQAQQPANTPAQTIRPGQAPRQ